jgi:orotate phosphoribosyltransferase
MAVATQTFADRLAAEVERKRSQLVVGLDPQPDLLPVELRGDISRFCCGIVDAVAPHVVAVKPQLAFFEALAAAVLEHEPEATRLAGPELGAVALATAASLQSGLPFLIVRKAAKDYGTANRLEGVYDEGECVCLIEDVVTSGGALLEAVQALRDVGLRVSNAICVVDREEGGVDELARHAIRLRPLFRASEILES